VRHAALQEVVVSAARLPQALANVIPATTVFTREDIVRSGASDLPGLMTQAPGAEIVTNGGLGSTASLLLRGASANQSLLLIDGIRIDSASIGAAQLAMLATATIDRVEVVNGNVSALYGSSAIGGVVQVFTDDGASYPPRFHFETSYGRYRTQRQTAGVAGALDASGDTTFRFTVSRVKTASFSSIDPRKAPGANPNDNGYRAVSAVATLQHRFNDGWRAGLRYLQSDGRKSFDNAYGLPSDDNEAISQVRMLALFVEGRVSNRWTTRLTAAEGVDRTTAYLNDRFDSRFDTLNRQWHWRNTVAMAERQHLVFGYERLEQSLDSNAYIATGRRVNAAYLGYDGRFGASRFQLNVRRDHYSDFGGAHSYFLGYGLELSDHWTASASYSTAFRAPSFNDLYYPGYGNPAVRPEQSRSWEAALQYASQGLGIARVSLFQTAYRDLIAARQVSSGVYAAMNIGRARVRGVETSWRGALASTDIRASFSIQQPVDQSANVDLSRRARRFATISASRAFGDWRATADWRISSARTDGATLLGGYAVLNVGARYQLSKSWFVAGRIDNILNKQYELADTYNTPGRGIYATLGWQQR